jgi:hypothetical protein
MQKKKAPGLLERFSFACYFQSGALGMLRSKIQSGSLNKF